MAGWKKHFTLYQGQESNSSKPSSSSRFQSWLPEVYSGQPNRVERYAQYDQMDMDSEINAALDIISEFSTQVDETTKLPFGFVFKEDATESEVRILEQTLRQWCSLNDWDRRMFKTFRNIIKYGDQFFIRDPETWELFYVNPVDVSKVIINEAKGKEPEQYVVKNIDLNIQNKTVSKPVQHGQTYGTVNTMMRGQAMDRGAAGAGGNFSQGYGASQDYTVDASHIVHSAMTEGMDSDFPFGTSILDPIFKTYKQKELLEDAIIIYRVQRAPERRVFYVDVGNMPANKAMGFVERVKNEIHQKRIPSRNGGGTTIMDAAYNPLCLSMDTTVPLLDGRTLTITQLAEEYQNGIENWTYSCDPITGEIVPGNITWAGVTRKNTQVIKLTLDDGTTLVVTPDHKIPVMGKGFVEAKDLTSSDSLISYKTRKQGLSSSSSDRTYTQIYDHNQNEWVYTHRMVAGFFKNMKKHQEFTYLPENVGKYKSIVHHKDFNRYNNDPKNLQWMNKDDHIKYHQAQNMWQHLTDAESSRIKDKISKSIKYLWATGVYDVENIRAAQKKLVYLRNNDETFKSTYKKSQSKSRKLFLENNPQFIIDVLMPNLSKWSKTIPNQAKIYTFDQLQAIYDLAVKHDFKMKHMLRATEDHDRVLAAIAKTNVAEEGKHFKIKIDELTQQVIYNTIHHYGYKNWMDFKRKKYEFNHRVVTIEYLDKLQDTGTITIDGNERWHAHHTFPINDSIFVKNSIMEDYFFAQTADGRGSKVEVLPGGTNLGEIDDLRYFTNKMLRALRVPSSYLPTGPDDGSATYTDGKVGTAFIQEYRFNQYCQRLQNIIGPTFDKEFKLFMKNRGINIDSGIFELRFVEPQSFSQYKEIEIHNARSTVFSNLEAVPYLSRRFLLSKYLGLTEEEILENERMWEEENTSGAKPEADSMPGLGSVGVRGFDSSIPPDAGLDSEETDLTAPEASPISGAENATAPGGEANAQ